MFQSTGSELVGNNPLSLSWEKIVLMMKKSKKILLYIYIVQIMHE